jgi:hypothetical protein
MRVPPNHLASLSLCSSSRRMHLSMLLQYPHGTLFMVLALSPQWEPFVLFSLVASFNCLPQRRFADETLLYSFTVLFAVSNHCSIGTSLIECCCSYSHTQSTCITRMRCSMDNSSTLLLFIGQIVHSFALEVLALFAVQSFHNGNSHRSFVLILASITVTLLSCRALPCICNGLDACKRNVAVHSLVLLVLLVHAFAVCYALAVLCRAFPDCS